MTDFSKESMNHVIMKGHLIKVYAISMYCIYKFKTYVLHGSSINHIYVEY